MQRYFFHTDDERGSVVDVVGIECLDDNAAKQKAIYAFGEMLMDADETSQPLSLVMRVVHQNGAPVCRLCLRVGDPQ